MGSSRSRKAKYSSSLERETLGGHPFLAGQLALRSAIGMAALASSTLLVPAGARAACVTGAAGVQCDDTSTTNTTYATNVPGDRNYLTSFGSQLQLVIDPGSTISGFGLAITNTGSGGAAVFNGGAISVDAGNSPSAGGTAALTMSAAGGPIIYTGGAITNNGAGNAFDVVQTGAGSTDINVSGNITAASGAGIVVRDTTAGGNISVTTGAVTALTAGKDGIDVQAQSLTGNVTEVANGDIRAGNAGIVGAIIPAAASGDIDLTANGAIDARFGIDAENFGSGSTTVKTVGPVTATTGNGLFAQTSGGNVTVTAGDVSSTGNTAIVARQIKAAGAGAIAVTAGNVSGTTGIEATNSGTGATSVTATGTVVGTLAEGIKVTGNGAVNVTVAGTVTGATRGLSLVGGTGGSGNISVTGTGGFVGQTGDAANILNNGSGTTTVDISGASRSTSGAGIVVRDTTAGGNISVTTGAVTALTAGKDGIDVQAQSLTGNVTEVANGDIRAGNPGIVGAIIPAAASGDIDLTANGAIDARFGIDAENFGSGSTTVKTVGPVTATTGNGLFAQTSGGNVTVTAGDVSSTGNTAIVARQIKAAGAGAIAVTAGNVSGTTGIEATNSGTVVGTMAEGIKVTGNGAVNVTVAGTVTGATNGVTLTGGTGSIAVLSSGTIRSISGLSSGEAIHAGGGPVMLTNGGSIIGAANFGAAADTFVNAGTWSMAGGTSDFGGGGDTLRNAASGVIDAAGAGAPAMTTLNNLALLVNQGRMTMVNGIAGDAVQTSGNARFESGSVYAIDIDSTGQSDRFTAQGNVQLGGTVAVSVSGGTVVPGSHYTVVTASGGVSGHFDSLLGGTAFLVLHDNYDANNAYLDIEKRAFALAGLTPNQTATAGALDGLPISGSLYNAILDLPNDTVAQYAFDQLSGEIHASANTALIEDSRFLRSAVNDRIRAAFDSVGAANGTVVTYDDGKPRAAAATTDGLAVWGQGFGSWGHTDGDGNAAGLDRSTGGFFIGADAPVFDTWRFGAVAGYSSTDLNVEDRHSSGSSDNYHFGLYGGTQWGALAFRTGAAYTSHDISTSREVMFPGFSDSLKGDYNAGTTQVFGELGYGMRAGNVAFEPFANLSYISLKTDGFTEKGGAAALTGASATTDATYATLGLRTSTAFTMGGVHATARSMLGWRHAFDDVTPLASMAFAGGSPFTIAGVPITRDAPVVEAGLDFQLSSSAVLGITYSGQFGSGIVDQSVKANFNMKF
ncbi:autotransporter outer membrane beta-barrel domain-containing protein [Rhizobium leguminosarum]|uniref:autotransporter outer membrane beta-barrel domain-containing protein n=1 Tax=Rhizobium leguminosarum TaxID=384 RepID=UPI001AE5BC89|nr:autotransporter domain-containing protein [Rhizobium leguminosarum]MBP2449068.1 outer membrane autotransporter protein [Rhizobium leguminosarum]